MKTIIIGITRTEARYENYPNWIKGNVKNIHIIQLTPENINELQQCNGIVLTGGVDTHPRFYNNKRFSYPNAPKQFNEKRDEFELTVFNYSQEYNIPVMAICRGMQLVNIALGGDMIQDIEEAQKLNHKKQEGKDGIHAVAVSKSTLLYEITHQETGTVNSAHHQALNRIADDLIISASSPDGIAEAAEWKDKTNKPFLLCVQWHPERLIQEQPSNPFTSNIREAFISAIKQNILLSPQC